MIIKYNFKADQPANLIDTAGCLIGILPLKRDKHEGTLPHEYHVCVNAGGAPVAVFKNKLRENAAKVLEKIEQAFRDGVLVHEIEMPKLLDLSSISPN